jgi:exo-beta-1,3-glucanase (GH17 family)/cellulose synthase/poly-beta-1,6-N-acetylglucosamine synthase-like glycosyltransferase
MLTHYVFLFSLILAFALPFISFKAKTTKTKKLPTLKKINSVSYSPFSTCRSIKSFNKITQKKIIKDLHALKDHVAHIRTYSVSGIQSLIPGAAELLGIKISLGVWISANEEKNQKEIKTAIRLINAHKNITRVIVGNEVLFRHEISFEKLTQYLTQMKDAVTIPVTTADLWHIWLNYPELANYTDEIAVHALPFWEGVGIQESVDYIAHVTTKLNQDFPGRKIYFGEVGWPSGGHIFNAMPCDQYQQAEHIRGIVNELDIRGVDFNVIEAFDQQWKLEGNVGSKWGIFNAHGTPKFVLGKQDYIPEESYRVFLYRFYRRRTGRILIIVNVLSLLLACSESIWRTLLPFTTLPFIMLAIACWIAWFIAVTLCGLHETFERYLMPDREPVKGASPNYNPSKIKVSIHIACCNEPPKMLIQTLSRLADLYHNNYEVLVLDNNTTNPDLWHPVRDYCLTLGEHFRFWHMDHLEGFKGGALNFLLSQTDDHAEIIAVVDSDYNVERDWLKLLFYFQDPHVAVVQAPQDYSDRDSLFKEICYYEYKSFFNTGMIIRENFNAIILHGTMTLIRKSVLNELPWTEDCICEDAEMGLRILAKKYKMKYIPVSYGQGLMPDTFTDYKKQRSRWVAGAVQILITHFSKIFMSREELSLQQRYQFIVGWGHWLIQPASVALAIALMMWTALVLLLPVYHLTYPTLISLSSLSAFGMMLAIQHWLYIKYSPDGKRGAILSILASQALNYTVAKAVVSTLMGRHKTFTVTPKLASHSKQHYLPYDCIGESLLFSGLVILSVATAIFGTGTTGYLLWSAMLALRSLPFGLAVLMSYLSAKMQRYPTRQDVGSSAKLPL